MSATVQHCIGMFLYSFIDCYQAHLQGQGKKMLQLLKQFWISQKAIITRKPPKNAHKSCIPGWSHLIQAVSSSLGPALQTNIPDTWECSHQNIHPVHKGEKSAVSSEVEDVSFFRLLCAFTYWPMLPHVLLQTPGQNKFCEQQWQQHLFDTDLFSWVLCFEASDV